MLLHHDFERWAAETPDATVLVNGDEHSVKKTMPVLSSASTAAFSSPRPGPPSSNVPCHSATPASGGKNEVAPTHACWFTTTSDA